MTNKYIKIAQIALAFREKQIKFYNSAILLWYIYIWRSLGQYTYPQTCACFLYLTTIKIWNLPRYSLTDKLYKENTHMCTHTYTCTHTFLDTRVLFRSMMNEIMLFAGKWLQLETVVRKIRHIQTTIISSLIWKLEKKIRKQIAAREGSCVTQWR